MSTLTFPYNLTAGQPENVNELNSNLNAIKSVLNGGLDTANLVAAAGIVEAQIASSVTRRIPTLVTSLPGSPSDGQVIDYVADATNGVVWRLRYRSASASAYKWEFVGGASLLSEVTTAETTASGTYAALATAGPSLTLTLAGDYDVTIETQIGHSAAAGFAGMSYDIGATPAVDADFARFNSQVAAQEFHAIRTRRKTNVAAATALVAKYRTSVATATFEGRVMRALPVRVG